MRNLKKVEKDDNLIDSKKNLFIFKMSYKLSAMKANHNKIFDYLNFHSYIFWFTIQFFSI